MRDVLVLGLALAACSSPKPAPKIEHRAAPRPAPPARCTGVTAKAIVAPKDTAIALAEDKELVFRGSSLDHFEDGTAAIMLQLEVAGSSWLPDAGDTAWHEIAGICMRVVKLATEDELELELDAAALPQDRRCLKQCCTTPESQRPAPDGTVECCFCTTD